MMTQLKLPENIKDFLQEIAIHNLGLSLAEIETYESLQDSEGKMTLIRCVRKLDEEGIDVTDVDAEDIVDIAVNLVITRLNKI